MVIRRAPLREAIREAILERLDSGALAVGADVNEPVLAAELGVSRTPLREALLGLQHEGLLVALPGRGWRVAPVTPQVVADVYPIIWTLEIAALRFSDPDDLAARADELEARNAQLTARTDDPVARMRLDDSWHAYLLAGCANRRLLDLIAAQKRIVHRYEFAYMSEPDAAEASSAQHLAIVAALRRRDVAEAARHLEANWRSTVEAMRDVLAHQPPTDGGTRLPA